MKSTDLALLFSIYFLSFLFVLDYKGMLLSKAFFTKIEYNQTIDRIVEDTMCNIIEEDYYNQSISINKEILQMRFFERMNYGLGEGSNCNLVSMIFTEQDGFYVYEKQGNGQFDIGKFGEKRYYQEGYEGFEIQYQFQDYMRIVKSDKDLFFEGTKAKIIQELEYFEEIILEKETKNSISLLKGYLKKESFEENKKKIIITKLREVLEEDINQTTKMRTGKKSYRVSIPYIQYEEWYQTIEGISLLTYFVAPSIRLMEENYERFVFSGGYLRKKVAAAKFIIVESYKFSIESLSN